MSLTYFLPPHDDNDQPVERTFMELAPVTETALLLKAGRVVPGIVLGPDRAIALTWSQAATVHRLLGEWLAHFEYMQGRGEHPAMTIASEAL